MPVMTLDHAATHLGLPVDTLHCWRQTGHLVAVQHPCVRGQWLVDVQHLLEVDLAMSRGTATQVALPPMTARALAEWLSERTGLTVTQRAVEDWAEDGDLRRVNAGGRGVRALYDPYRGAAVHAARTRRLPVAPATDTLRRSRFDTATDRVMLPISGRVSMPATPMTTAPDRSAHGT